MRRVLLFSLAMLLISGCSTSRVSRGAVTAVAPQLSVERFLQAANSRDLESMARLFGTKGGPISDTGSSFGCFWKRLGTLFGGDSCLKWQDVELRMDAIAGILRHEDYRLSSEASVAGRDTETTRLGVNLTINGRVIRNVGFTVVRRALLALHARLRGRSCRPALLKSRPAAR